MKSGEKIPENETFYDGYDYPEFWNYTDAEDSQVSVANLWIAKMESKTSPLKQAAGRQPRGKVRR